MDCIRRQRRQSARPRIGSAVPELSRRWAPQREPNRSRSCLAGASQLGMDRRAFHSKTLRCADATTYRTACCSKAPKPRRWRTAFMRSGSATNSGSSSSSRNGGGVRSTGSRASRGEETAPSTQMLRYLRRVDDITAGKLRWGILTNGGRWRLYYQGARSVSEQFFEIDLAAVLGVPGHDGGLFALTAENRAYWLKVFALMFRREAFIPSPDRSAHIPPDRARRRAATMKSGSRAIFRNLVFGFIFPTLVQSIAAAAPAAPLRRGARRRADPSLPPAVHPLRRGSRPAAGQRPALRRVRLARSSRRDRPSKGSCRRIFGDRGPVLVCSGRTMPRDQ